MTTRIPTWLTHHIETTTGARPGWRNATPRLCHCGAWTLTGGDADLLATTATVDPTPLTAAGELTCILTSRPTYELATRHTGRLALDRRDHYRIRGWPPGTGRFDVLPAHRCHTHPLDGPLTTTTVHRPPATAQTTGPPPY